MSHAVYRAEAGDEGKRLDVWLAHQLDVSRSRAQQHLTNATLNGKAVKPSHVLRAGDELQLALETAPLQKNGDATHQEEANAATAAVPLTFPTEELEVLFEDDYLVVLNKPRGLSVHVGAGHEGEATLVDVLRARGTQLSSVGAPERPGIVHRLDRDTTGVMVVAKTDAAHWKLAAAFAERDVTKEYLALVCSVPSARGRIEAPIGRHPGDRKKMAIVAGGKPAVTEYALEQWWSKFALVRVNLLTGRTHQIRVHLARLGHPVVGDETYGGAKRALQTVPHQEAKKALEALEGQALHAHRLEFAHPITEAGLSFVVPLPEDVNRLVAALGNASHTPEG